MTYDRMMNSNLPRRAAFLVASCLALPVSAFNHVDTVAPKAQGPFKVACSNIAQDPTRIQAGASATDYWEGRDHYINDILAYPDSVVRFSVRVPLDPVIYPGNWGRNVDFAAMVCFPTSITNTDPDYVLPQTGDVVPRMQAPGTAPKLISWPEFGETLGGHADPRPPAIPMRLPLIVFSHGLTGSPISPGYVSAMVLLASHGFMVGAVFHGDPRFSRVRIEDLSDAAYAVVNFSHIVEMQLMRPLSLRAMTDTLLADPQFSPAIDTDRIGGFGASLGGEAMLHLLGARITTTIGFACHDAPSDPRIKAAVALVPYAGQTFLPAFCDQQSGVDSVDRPFLALSGTADTTAPIKLMDSAIRRMRGSRYLVELAGVPHEYKPEYAGDLFTWMVTFFDAYLKVDWDGTAINRLIRMQSVQGGPQDDLRIDVHVPTDFASGEYPALEFRNSVLNHYFVSAGPGEIDAVMNGGAGPGWQLTGQKFKVWGLIPAATTGFNGVGPVCRFYGGLNGGPNSHFYTAVQGECDWVKSGGAGPWAYEGVGFYIRSVDASFTCPDGYLGVNRVYNNGWMRNDSNHRFSTSDSTIRDMQSEGWTYEGLVMCARP
jgi:hypothetical protein